MKMKLLLAMLCVSFVLPGCATKPAKPLPTYAGGGYTLTVPAGWDVEKNGSDGVDMIAVYLEDVDPPVLESVNVVLDRFPTMVSEKKFLAMNLRELKKGFPIKAHRAFVPAKVGPYSGYRLEYEMSTEGLQLEIDLYIVIHDNIAYAITCGNLKGGGAKFAPKKKAILASFSIK